jgi:hypothetical protein
MKPLFFLLPLALIALLLVTDYAGYAGSTAGGLAGNVVDVPVQGSKYAQEDAQAAIPSSPAPQGADSNVYLDVVSVNTDKDLYHSAEVMKLTAVIASGEDVTGAVVTASGLNGKMSASKTVDLIEGGNTVEFEYTLPRCNTCGGIPAGSYTCTLSASYGDSSVSKDFTVEIRQ